MPDFLLACKNLPRKPEVVLIAQLTGRSRRDVASILLWDLWSWADDESTDGFVPGCTVGSLVDVLGQDEAFWLAVQQSGWLKFDEKGMTIPNFDRWLGSSAKARVQKSRRQARWRAKANPVDDLASTGASTREEKRREEKKEDVNTSSSATGKRSKRERKPRKRDDLWDAVVTVTGSDSNASASHIGRVCSCLRSAEPPYTPAEVLALPQILSARGFTLPLTLGTVEKNIGWTRLSPQEHRHSGEESIAEKIARIERKKQCRDGSQNGPDSMPSPSD